MASISTRHRVGKQRAGSMRWGCHGLHRKIGVQLCQYRGSHRRIGRWYLAESPYLPLKLSALAAHASSAPCRHYTLPQCCTSGMPPYAG
eukprot:670502-Rhodomonas_salina.3